MNNPIRFAVDCDARCAGRPSALAAPVSYEIDAKHTHPLFVADHFGGVSKWRGIFSASGGKIVLDREAKSGTVEVTIDTSSVLTGVPDLDKHLKGATSSTSRNSRAPATRAKSSIQGQRAHRSPG